MQSFIDLLSATKLQSNKINVAVAGKSWFSQNWMAWQLLERWRKTEKNLERIRRKMFVLCLSTLEKAKIAKKGENVDGRVGELDRARPKLCSSSILMMKKIIAKKFRKRKKSADVRRCWNKISLVNYLEDT